MSATSDLFVFWPLLVIFFSLLSQLSAFSCCCCLASERRRGKKAHEKKKKTQKLTLFFFFPLKKKKTRPPPPRQNSKKTKQNKTKLGIPFLGLFAIQQIVFGFLETSRYQAWKSGEKNALFPLDPAGMNSDANAVKEIKNGRLAMVAFVGFAVQALVTREGPIEGLFGHLASPFSHNIIGNIANLPNVIGK